MIIDMSRGKPTITPVHAWKKIRNVFWEMKRKKDQVSCSYFSWSLIITEISANRKLPVTINGFINAPAKKDKLLVCCL